MKKLVLLISAFLLPILLLGQNITGIDQITPFNEGLAAIKKGDSWGFINPEGELVIDFRNDLVWNEEVNKSETDVSSIAYPRFVDGRCMIKSTLEEEGIITYGFIDKNGSLVIEPEYLNLTEFKDGYAVGILVTKSFRGKNNFQLNIYDFKFSEVLIDSKGDIMLLINKRDGISMSTRRYERPSLMAKYLSRHSLAVKSTENTWEIKPLNL
ncbi:WG repeat-containing protein [Eudoraea sp.]|uniref:WG repeat-containing protein n=1 Tax=Eudoraea sp. TaxID=1979955 RepID=UPI003C71350D